MALSGASSGTSLRVADTGSAIDGGVAWNDNRPMMEAKPLPVGARPSGVGAIGRRAIPAGDRPASEHRLRALANPNPTAIERQHGDAAHAAAVEAGAAA